MTDHLVRRGVVSTAVALAFGILAPAALAQSGPAQGAAPSPVLGPWYGFRDGYQGRGVSTVDAAQVTAGLTGRAPGSVATHGLIWATPVIDTAGNVYVGSADKTFYALTPDGQTRWTFKLPDVGDSLIDSAATLTPEGFVVVPGGDGALHALDKDTGALVWEFKSYHGNQQAGIVVNSFEGNVTLGPDGNLYAGCDDGYLYCVDRTGNEVWHFQTNMMVWSAPAFEPGGSWLAFGSLDKHLYVLDRATGKQLASYQAGAEIESSPAIDDAGRIYVGCSDGVVRCLELKGSNLSVVWSFATGGDVYSSPALAGDRVVFGSHDGNVYCVSTAGKLLWQYSLYSYVSASPLVTQDGVVLVGAKNGKLYALDLATGMRRWSFKTAPGYLEVNLDSSPAIDATGRIFVGSYDGSLYSIPFEFAEENPTDARVSLDPGPDYPDFGGPVPQNGATLRFVDSEGALHPDAPGLVDPQALLTFQLVAHENGVYIPNALIAILDLKVSVSPPVPFTYQVGSGRTYLDLTPTTFWQPGTTYKLHVEGEYYHQGDLISDWLKWFFLPSFSADTTFTVAAPGTLPQAAAGSVLRYSIHEMYLSQPPILDSLVPAGVAGQAFIATIPVRNDAKGTLGVLAFAAYPHPDGSVALRADPDRVFFLNGSRDGDAVHLSGKTTLAAMGAEIPMDPVRILARFTDTGIQDGQIHGSSPVLEIKANGSSYTGFSWKAAEDLTDPWLELQAIGTFAGDRLAAPPVLAKLSSSSWSGSDLSVTVHRTATAADDHIVTAILADDAAGAILGAASATLAAGSLGQPETLVLKGLDRAQARRKGVALRFYFDGEPLN
jgi:outer membrane protein assembly factor BamB